MPDGHEIDQLYWTLTANRAPLEQAVGEAQKELGTAGEKAGASFGAGIAAGIASAAQAAAAQAGAGGQEAAAAMAQRFAAELAALPAHSRAAIEQLVSGMQAQGGAAGTAFVAEFEAKTKELQQFGLITPDQRARLIATLQATGAEAGQALGGGMAKAAAKGGKDAAAELIKSLQLEFKARMGAAQEQLAQGLISPGAFAKESKAATAALRTGLIQGMTDLRTQGALGTTQMAAFGSALEAVRPKTTLLGSAVQMVVTRLRLLASLALAMAAYKLTQWFESTVSGFAEVNLAVTRSLAIVGDLGPAMEAALGREVQETARRFNLEAKDLGDTLFFLASAGKTADQQLQDLPVVAALSKAGVMDLRAAAELLVDSTKALGLSSTDAVTDMKEMTRVADVLAKANTLSNATIQQFAEALTNRAAAALRLVNKDVEEGVAVLAAYAQQGVKGAVAGQQLYMMLRDLQRAALQHAQAFRDAKVAVYDSGGAMRNVADIIGDLEKKMDGLSDAQKRATLIQLGFQDRSIAAIQGLLGLSGAIREYEAQLRTAAGTTDTLANRQMKAFSERAGQLSQDWKELKRRVGEALLPVAEMAMEAGKGLLFGLDDPLEHLIEQFQKLGDTAEAVMGLKLMQRVDDTKKSIADLTAQINKATMLTGETTTRAGGKFGTRFVVPTTRNLGQLGLSDLYGIQAGAVAGLAKAQNDLGSSNEVVRLQAQQDAELYSSQIDAVDRVILAKSQLEAENDRLTATEKALNEQLGKVHVEQEIRALDARIERLVQEGAAINVIFELEKQRKALADQLNATVTPTKPPPEEGGGTPDLEGERRASEAKAAAEALQRQLDEYRQLQRGGFQRMEEVPQPLREQLERILQIDKDIAQAEDNLQKARKLATPEMVAMTNALVASLQAEKLELVTNSQAILDMLARLPSVLQIVPQLVGQGVTDLRTNVAATEAAMKALADAEHDLAIERKNEDPTAIAAAEVKVAEARRQVLVATVAGVAGYAQMKGALDQVEAAVRAVAEAEADLTRARLLNDPGKVAAAENALTAARKHARDVVATLTAELLKAGLNQKQMNVVVAIFVDLFKEAGIQIDQTKTKLSGFRETVRTIREVTDAVLSIADAMGGLDDQTKKVIKGIGDMAEGITQIEAGNVIGGGAQVVGGLVSVVGGILGSEKAAAEAARLANLHAVAAMADLQHALEALTKATLQTISQKEKESTISTVDAIVQATGGGWGYSKNGPVQNPFPQLDALTRVTPALIEAIRTLEQQTGITFYNEDTGIIDLQKFYAALDAFKKLDLSAWADDLTGSMERLDWEFQQLGDGAVDAKTRVNALLGVIKKFAPQFADSVQQILDTEGPDAALAYVQDLIRRLGEGDQTLFAEGGAFYGMSAEDVKALLEEMNRYLQDMASGGASGQTTAFQVSRTITERQADLLISVLVTMVYWQERGVAGIEAMARAVTGGAWAPPEGSVPAGGNTPPPAAVDFSALLDPTNRTATATEAILAEVQALLAAVQEAAQPVAAPSAAEIERAFGAAAPVFGPVTVEFGELIHVEQLGTAAGSLNPTDQQLLLDAARQAGLEAAARIDTVLAKRWGSVKRAQGRS